MPPVLDRRRDGASNTWPPHVTEIILLKLGLRFGVGVYEAVDVGRNRRVRTNGSPLVDGKVRLVGSSGG